MEALVSLNVLLLVGVILTISSDLTEAIECYVCSWNPMDYKSSDDGSSDDYRDVCSAAHFDPERVRTHECHRGCEIVSMRDPNGELEMYYRNCVTNKQITYAFIKKNSKLNNEEIYTCDFDLCNDATIGRFYHSVLLTSLLLPSLHWLFM